MPRAHWILAVLQDLQRYAATNGMMGLAAELDAAIETAIGELPLAEEPAPATAPGLEAADRRG